MKDLRQGLKSALIRNRTRSGSGKGEKYWESVMDTIEEFLERECHIDASVLKSRGDDSMFELPTYLDPNAGDFRPEVIGNKVNTIIGYLNSKERSI